MRKLKTKVEVKKEKKKKCKRPGLKDIVKIKEILL